jgi:hypothetical protein
MDVHPGSGLGAVGGQLPVSESSSGRTTFLATTARPVPTFESEAEERRFWESHDWTDHLDWSKVERVRLPNLRPSTTSISRCLPVSLLERIKVAAHKRDVPYQSPDQDLAHREARRRLSGSRSLSLRAISTHA